MRTATAVALAICAAAAALPASAAAVPSGPAPTFTFTSHLERLLVSPRLLGRITDSGTPMQVVATRSELIDNDADIEPAACVGAFEPGHRSSYASEPAAATTALVADGKPSRALHFVNQTVLSVSDHSAAQDQLRLSARTWSRCGGQTITRTRNSGDVDRWQLETTELRRDSSVLVQRQTGKRTICERAMTTAVGEGGAIIADVLACDLRGGDPTGQAEQIAAAIAANVGQAG